MEKDYYVDEEFENEDFSENEIFKVDFESCIFKSCNFSNSQIKNCDFNECKFENCNLGMMKLNNTSVREVEFINCKVVGVDFSVCNPFLFSMRCSNSHLDYSVFYALKMKNTIFNDCSLKEVDFTECDMQGSQFINCNMENSSFERTNLMKCDFTTSYNFNIDPESNKIKKAKFSINGLQGLLMKYNLDIE